ncbi:MAG TPA: TonB-dependent receptor [Tepidisphaeraceae bacterium]|jgi:iron complex outermembrane receptor protein|nr:TonB-dependent receptor [Tepidisphaeraceae bacterium]
MELKSSVVRASVLASILAGGTSAAMAADMAPDTRPTVVRPAATQPTTEPEPAAANPNGEAVRLEPIIVTAERVPQRLQDVPVSETVVGGDLITADNVHTVDQAASYVPNLVENRFTQTRLASPFIRGIGSGENDPAVAEYIDGVPQLNLNVVNVELAGVDRIEFLRGPQGTLYGRNSLGGVINIFTRQPTNDYDFSEETTFGNYYQVDERFDVGGPIVQDKLFFEGSGVFSSRDGYNVNLFDGNRIDNKDHLAGRFELRYTPTDKWDIRLTYNNERDHDGDYAIYNLASLYSHPNRVDHDFPGYSHRDIDQVALSAHYAGDQFDFTTVTAYQHWHSQDVDDLDETQFDLIRENNKEGQQNLTEEFRFTNPQDKPIVLSDVAKIRWVVGSLWFLSDYNQSKFYNYRPDAITALGIPFSYNQVAQGNLNDWSASFYGQATLVLWDKLELTAGARYDHEHREGRLFNYTQPTLGPSSEIDASRDFDHVSPRFELGYHWDSTLLTYATVAEGYRSGGFNVVAPAGGSSYGQETSWSYEAGVKKTFFDDRLTVNADVFYLDWSHIQEETPLPGAPGEFYYSNSGDAYSHGAELEFNLQATDALNIFGGGGLTQANFGGGSRSSGANVGGHDLPYAPDFTYNAGVQYTFKLPHDMKAYARAEIFGVGRYFYDASNAVAQSNYQIADFRLGVSGQFAATSTRNATWRLEGWIKNAFDQHYYPVAFPFSAAPGAAGYVGETGDPLTMGVTLGFDY